MLNRCIAIFNCSVEITQIALIKDLFEYDYAVYFLQLGLVTEYYILSKCFFLILNKRIERISIWVQLIRKNEFTFREDNIWSVKSGIDKE